MAYPQQSSRRRAGRRRSYRGRWNRNEHVVPMCLRATLRRACRAIACRVLDKLCRPRPRHHESLRRFLPPPSRSMGAVKTRPLLRPRQHLAMNHARPLFSIRTQSCRREPKSLRLRMSSPSLHLAPVTTNVAQRWPLWRHHFAREFFVSIGPTPMPAKHSSYTRPLQVPPRVHSQVAKPIGNVRSWPVNSPATQP